MDSHLAAGTSVSSSYDSLLAKLIVHGKNRAECVATMQRALDEFIIEGVSTTIPLYRRLFRNSRYMRGGVDTGFIERTLGQDQGLSA